MTVVIATEEELAADRVAAEEQAERIKLVRVRANELEALALDLEENILAIKGTAEDWSREKIIREVELVMERLDEVRDHQYAMVAEALGDRWTASDVRAWCEHAVELGARHPTFPGALLRDLIQMNKVPVAPFRERLWELEDQYAALVEAHGAEHGNGEEPWLSGRHSGDRMYLDSTPQQALREAMGWDDRALKRNLGINIRPSGNGNKSLTLFVDYELASRLAPTLGLKPHAAGI